METLIVMVSLIIMFFSLDFNTDGYKSITLFLLGAFLLLCGASYVEKLDSSIKYHERRIEEIKQKEKP